PYDQIIRKLRVGLDVAKRENKQFFFIFLDIAPEDKILKYGEEKAASAQYFKQYKNFEHYKKDSDTFAEMLIPNTFENIRKVSENMGWLTWASLFKIVLRSIINETKTAKTQVQAESDVDADMAILKINTVHNVLLSKVLDIHIPTQSDETSSKRFRIMAETKLIELIGRL